MATPVAVNSRVLPSGAGAPPPQPRDCLPRPGGVLYHHRLTPTGLKRSAMTRAMTSTGPPAAKPTNGHPLGRIGTALCVREAASGDQT